MLAETLIYAEGEDTVGDYVEVVITGEDVIDNLVLRHLDGSTPTFSLDADGTLRASLKMRK